MLLYNSDITPRLKYIVDFISRELFVEAMIITDEREKFINSNEPKINYSDVEFSEAEFYIKPVSLLFEKGIRQQTIHCFELNYHKAFFQTQGDFSFDIFAACFYLLSRYEEYLPHEKDEYNRYAYTNSLAHKEHFPDQPLVNIWLQELKQALKNKFSNIIFRHSSFQFIPTYDIDVAYSYLYKGWWRNTGGLVKSLGAGDWKFLKERLNVLRKKQRDPYDAYEWLDSPIIFFSLPKSKKDMIRIFLQKKLLCRI